jgi:hypothetical protein
MSNLSTMLRLNLFTYRDLLQWLHDPFGIPPTPPVVQLRLPGKKKRRTWFEEIAFTHCNILKFRYRFFNFVLFWTAVIFEQLLQ